MRDMNHTGYSHATPTTLSSITTRDSHVMYELLCKTSIIHSWSIYQRFNDAPQKLRSLVRTTELRPASKLTEWFPTIFCESLDFDNAFYTHTFSLKATILFIINLFVFFVECFFSLQLLYEESDTILVWFQRNKLLGHMPSLKSYYCIICIFEACVF